MRGAYGKPLGKVARVYIGKKLITIRCREKGTKHAVEALRRAKNKFPG
jgi:large subunit ribosomal protein L10e